MEQFQQKWTRFWQVMIVIAAALSMVATAMAGLNFVSGQAEEPVARSYSVPCYMEQGGAKFVASSGCEIELQSGATFDMQSGTTGDLDIGGLLQPSFADETITDGETLTPTVTVYALDSASAVTMTLAASADEGQLLILIGDDANNVLIADTNLRSSTGGALTLNQYDVAFFVYQDNEWIEIALLTNS